MNLIVSEMGKLFDKDRENKRYQQALDSYVERISKDKHVLTVLLNGSFAYDQVWHRSDLDMTVIHDDEKQLYQHQCHMESDVVIFTDLFSREHFLKQTQKSLQGGIFHHELFTTKIVYCIDDTLREYIDQFRDMGSRDREIQLMFSFSIATNALDKAGKMIFVKNNSVYATYYLTALISEMARITVLQAGKVPQREIILQALPLKPEFFKKNYLDVIMYEITAEILVETLRNIELYMDSIMEDIFKPVLMFLKNEGEPRSYSELWEKFIRRRSIWINFNFLADKGLLSRTLVPIHLTSKSRTTMYEPAFFYE